MDNQVLKDKILRIFIAHGEIRGEPIKDIPVEHLTFKDIMKFKMYLRDIYPFPKYIIGLIEV